MTVKFVHGWLDRNDVVLIDEDGFEKRSPAPQTAFLRAPVGLMLGILAEDPKVDSVDQSGDWVRINFKQGHYDKTTRRWINYRESMCRYLESNGISVFEADVSPLVRYMIDEKIEIGVPRRVYLDLEVDSRKSFDVQKSGGARILSWAIVDHETGSTLSEVLGADNDDDEIEMVSRLWLQLKEYVQIVAWNLDYDQAVLCERSKVLGIHHDAKRFLWLDQLAAFKKYNVSSAKSGAEKQSFKLGSIAMALLGRGKEAIDASKIWEVWEEGGQARADLLHYNEVDTQLCRDIELETGYLQLHQTVCEVAGCFSDSRSLKATRIVDMLLMRLGDEHNVHYPTKWFGDDIVVDPFEGAYVMQPKTNGVERNVHVADFAAMYPSILVSWNLGIDTIVGPEFAGPVATSPGNGVRTRTDRKSTLAIAIENLTKLRTEWKKKRALCTPGTPEAKDCERRTAAYKTVINSFYGCMGAPFSRFFVRDIAEGTTTNGVWLIKKVITEAERRGFRTVYADTDGGYFADASEEQFAEFVAYINSQLPIWLAGFGCQICTAKIAYEKAYRWIVFTAAKRYVGTYLHYEGTRSDETSEPEVRGLEYRRGDCNKYARELQESAINLLVKQQTDPEPFFALLNEFKTKILKAELPLEDVVISKSISRELKEYKSRTKKDGTMSSRPAHVELALKMKKLGEDVGVGTRISYVVVDASVSPALIIPASEYTGVSDRYFLWENSIYPPTERLLAAAFPSTDWRDWSKARPSRNYNPHQLNMFSPAVVLPP